MNVAPLKIIFHNTCQCEGSSVSPHALILKLGSLQCWGLACVVIQDEGLHLIFSNFSLVATEIRMSYRAISLAHLNILA